VEVQPPNTGAKGFLEEPITRARRKAAERRLSAAFPVKDA